MEERLSLWLPHYVPNSVSRSQALRLDQIISQMSRIIGDEYTLHPTGYVDDPSDWQPTNTRSEISDHSRVSKASILKLQALDREIGEILSVF